MNQKSGIDWELHLNKILDHQIPSRQSIRTICQTVSAIHRKEQNIISLQGTYYVVGDIHG